jgi:hypothetical protein
MAQLVEINQVGKREMLADFISLVDAKEKPLLAMIPKSKELTNMLMQWQADNYDEPSMEGIADGVDVENFENAAENRALLKNYCQKVRRTAMVGDIAENVSNVAGASSGEMARALSKKTEELSRDIEAILCSDGDAQEEASSALPYKTRGLGSWISNTPQTVLPVPTAYLTPAASLNATAIASVTEDGEFRPVLKSMYQQRGKRQDFTLLSGTDFRERITNFTRTSSGSTNTQVAVRAYNQDMNGKKIVNVVNVYEGDFNTVNIIPSLLLARNTSTGAVQAATNRRAYVLDLSMLELRWNRMPRVKQLEDQGGGPRALVDAIFGLCYKNPLIGGKFHATT